MSWYWHPPHEQQEFDLQTLAWNISTMGGRLRMAGRRGENVIVPFREGRLWVPKVYEETELELLMWVIGAEEDGEIPENPSDQFWTNVKTLQRLFYTERELGILSYDHPTLGQRVFAEAEIAEAIDFTTQAGSTRAAFVVTFKLPYVWFRPAQFGGDADYVTRENEEEWTIDIDSDVPIKDAIIRFRSSTGLTPIFSNVTLSNLSLSQNDHWVAYRNLIALGGGVEIDVGAWRALNLSGGDVSNSIDWSGQPEFFQLKPGENDLRVTYEALGDGDLDVQVIAKGRYW